MMFVFDEPRISLDDTAHIIYASSDNLHYYSLLSLYFGASRNALMPYEEHNNKYRYFATTENAGSRRTRQWPTQSRGFGHKREILDAYNISLCNISQMPLLQTMYPTRKH
jgi:hypothetical protein